MKPLEEHLWFTPQESIDLWIEKVDDQNFLTELKLDSADGFLVIGSYHNTRAKAFGLSVRVHTALVSPGTAAALVRALQTVDEPENYRIPPAGDYLEINVPPYKLVGWLADSYHDLRIDERDPLRSNVKEIHCRPSDQTARMLNLVFESSNPVRWVEAKNSKTAFVYDAWSDNRADEREERLRYDETVRSSGWRLQVSKEALLMYLNQMKLDLIVEVEITRRKKGYEYSRLDEEETEAQFERVLLFRRNGVLEAAEGRIGTWALPRT